MEKPKYNTEYEKDLEKRKAKPLVFAEESPEGTRIDIGGIKLESFATKEEVDKIVDEIYLVPEAFKILQAMAVTYSQNRGLIVEGETSLGKTFLMNKFTAMIFGEGQKPVDFYCNGQTDVLELMGKWVPNSENSEDVEEWEKYTKTDEYRMQAQKIVESAENGAGSDDIVSKYVDLYTSKTGKKAPSSWKFQLGSLPRAMSALKHPDRPAGPDNPELGNFIHIQEVGLAETHVIDALLSLGGEKGEIAEEITLTQDSNRQINSAPKFWIYYSTNPPENYSSRQAIDQALARRNTFVRAQQFSGKSDAFLTLKSDLSMEELRELAEDDPEIAGIISDVEERNKDLLVPLKDVEREGSMNLYNENPKIRAEILKTLGDFHRSLSEKMSQNKVDDGIRKQKFALTMDEKHMVIAALKNFNSGDIMVVLDRAIQLHYVDRFTDSGKERAWEEWLTIRENKNLAEKIAQISAEIKAKNANSGEESPEENEATSGAELELFRAEIGDLLTNMDSELYRAEELEKTVCNLD